MGNLDADLSFRPDYMEFLMRKFSEDPARRGWNSFHSRTATIRARDSFEGENYVAGRCQLFRRSVFRRSAAMSRTAPGGVDWIAVMTARMKGWKVRSFAEKRFHHHRTLGRRNGAACVRFFPMEKKIITSAARQSGNCSGWLIGWQRSPFSGRACFLVRLRVGSFAADEARRNPGADAFSPKGTDEKAASDISRTSEL